MCVVINFPLNESKSCQETNSCAIILTNDNNVSKRRILDYIVHDVPLFCQEEQEMWESGILGREGAKERDWI